MSQPAICASNISKWYQLGAAERARRDLREAIADLTSAPMRCLRRSRATAPAAESIWALKDISFEVLPGEVVGIIGRNGAGKSTLLKILSRIAEPTTGKLQIHGRVGSLLEVGTGFHPELTGRENIYLNGTILGMRRRELDREFDAIVEFSGVEGFLDTPVKRYSSGMYVRLAFAVAAHLNPEILIVDEVLAVGDAEFQKKCLGKMHDVAHSGRTVLFVSHNMAAVRQLCSSAMLLSGGCLIRKDTTNEVLSDYLAHKVSTQYLGAANEHGLEMAAISMQAARTGHMTNEPLFNEDHTLTIEMRAHRRFENAAVVIRVHDDMGMLVSSICGPEEGIDPFDFEDRFQVTFQLPRLQLLPGKYTISVFVYRPNDGTEYFAAENCLSFTVEPAIIHDAMWAYQQHHGLVRISDGGSVCRA